MMRQLVLRLISDTLQTLIDSSPELGLIAHVLILESAGIKIVGLALDTIMTG